MTEKLAQFKELKDQKGRAAAMQWVSMVGLKFAFQENRSDVEKQLMQLQSARRRLLQQVGIKHNNIIEIDEQIAMWQEVYSAGPGAQPETKSGSESEKPIKSDTLDTYAHAMEAKIGDCDKLLKGARRDVRNRTEDWLAT